MRLRLATVLAAALLLLNLAALAGAGYGRHAEERLDRPASATTVAAAQIAARWTPWSSAHAALAGWVAAANGDAEAAQATYARALRLAPADAVLWAEYALALARLGQFGASLTLASGQARRLAPTSPAVRRTIAELGLSYWQRGTGEQRGLWLEAMREELARNRAEFLRHVLTRGQGRAFCADAGTRLGEEAWCRGAARTLAEGCFVDTPAGPGPCPPAP